MPDNNGYFPSGYFPEGYFPDGYFPDADIPEKFYYHMRIKIYPHINIITEIRE